MKNRLVSRILPCPDTYNPLYTGKGVTVYVVTDIDPTLYIEIIRDISPDIEIKVVQSLQDIILTHTGYMAVLFFQRNSNVAPRPPSILSMLRRRNVLTVVPAGDSGVDVATEWPALSQDVITVGACDKMDKVGRESNYGCIDLYCPANNSIEAAAIAAAGVAQFIESNQCTDTNDLRHYVLQSATAGALHGAWSPADLDNPNQGKHFFNRLMCVPSAHSPMLWLTDPTITQSTNLRVHSDVSKITVSEVADLPEFVSINGYHLDIDISGVEDGLYQFWLVAETDTNKQTQLFNLCVGENIHDYALVNINGHYVELPLHHKLKYAGLS